MIKVQFFARTREALGADQVALEWRSNFAQVSDIVTQLCNDRPEWEPTLKDERVLVAVNQEMTSLEANVADGDEVAFFPPVTGG